MSTPAPQVASAGFEADAIEASMNTVEFSLREFNTGGFPKGLSLMLAVMPNWLYERGSPTDALRFELPLAALKKRLANGDSVFEDILRKRIVQNGHLATVEMKPDPEMAEREKKARRPPRAAPHAPRPTRRAPRAAPHTPRLTPRTPYIPTLHTAHCAPHTPHTPHPTPHTPHHTTHTPRLTPHASHFAQAEEASLAETKAKMSASELQGIIDATKFLKAAQVPISLRSPCHLPAVSPPPPCHLPAVFPSTPRLQTRAAMAATLCSAGCNLAQCRLHPARD